MITSETRPGSTPARSSAALMATAPRSWAGMVANAPLKLPTGVRAALTMTTSSDMDILLGLRVLDGGRRIGRPLSPLYPVNDIETCQRQRTEISAQRIQNDALGGPEHHLARGLTVPHKTVAEPY